MKFATIAILLISVTLAGCVNMAAQRRAFVQSHPHMSEKNRIRVLQGAVGVGMTKAQVLASWGEPGWLCYGTRDSSWGASWQYGSYPYCGTTIYFHGGRVSAWID